MPLSTVSGILTRIGLGKLSRLEPPEPPNRYERRRPGELIHIDVKKLGRIGSGAGHRVTGNRAHRAPTRDAAAPAGSSCTSAIDDATRLAYVEVLADEKATTAIGFLRRALALLPPPTGSQVERVMTDNGSAYRSAVARARLPRARPQAPAHPALPAAHQRQGRALHPHPARRLGLRRHLPRLAPSATAALSGWLDYYNADDHTAPSATSRPASRLAR